MSIQKLFGPGGTITYLIFFATVSITIISLIPAVFPAFFTTSISNIPKAVINPLEFGVLAIPILSVNIITITILVMYKMKKLPQSISQIFVRIFNFDVSKKLSLIILGIIITAYIITSAAETYNNEFETDYYGIFKPWIETFDVLKLPDNQLNHDLGHHVQIFAESLSMKIFNSYKVIPYFASITLLIITYFLTYEITKNRFAGIITTLIIIQSDIFRFYDTSVSYTNLWVLFFVCSLYLILKKWQASPISFVFGTLSKGLTAVFLPAIFLFAYRAKNPSRKVLIEYAIFIVALVVFLLVTGTSLNPVDSKKFDAKGFVNGFTAFGFEFIQDYVVVCFLLPLIIALFILSKNGNQYADSIMMLITIMLISAPLLSALSINQNVAYRFVPLIVFFALGTGLVFSKKKD